MYGARRVRLPGMALSVPTHSPPRVFFKLSLWVSAAAPVSLSLLSLWLSPYHHLLMPRWDPHPITFPLSRRWQWQHYGANQDLLFLLLLLLQEDGQVSTQTVAARCHTCVCATGDPHCMHTHSAEGLTEGQGGVRGNSGRCAGSVTSPNSQPNHGEVDAQGGWRLTRSGSRGSQRWL